jgi:hypothetical protein
MRKELLMATGDWISAWERLGMDEAISLPEEEPK